MVNGQEGKWNRGPVWMRVISEVGFVYDKGDEAMRMMGTVVGLVCAIYPDELGWLSWGHRGKIEMAQYMGTGLGDCVQGT